jgi:hypothetical protein
MVEEVNMHQQQKKSRTFVHAWMFEDFQVARFRHDRQQPPVFGDVARVGVAPLFVGPHALRAPPAGSREGFPFFVFQIGSTTGCVEIVKEIKTNERQKIGQNLATPQTTPLIEHKRTKSNNHEHAPLTSPLPARK